MNFFKSEALGMIAADRPVEKNWCRVSYTDKVQKLIFDDAPSLLPPLQDKAEQLDEGTNQKHLPGKKRKT